MLHPAVLETLFGQAPVGMAVFDRQMMLLLCNVTWAEFIDLYTPTSIKDVIPGKYFFELAPGAEEFLSPVLERVLKGETVQLKAMRSVSGGIESFWDATFTPLLRDGTVVGVLDMTTDATERVQTLKTLEARVAERTRELEHRREVAESLRDIIGMINSKLPLDDFLQKAVELAAQRMGAAACILHQIDIEHQLITPIASFGMEDFINFPGIRSFDELGPSGSEAFLQATLQNYPTYGNYSPLPERIVQIEADPSIPEEIKKERIAIRKKYAGSFSAPLFIQGKVYGGMVFYYTDPQEFHQEQIQLGLTFAEQVAVAIENARLFQEAEQRRMAAESLGRIVTVINSDQSVDQILATIVQIASQLLGANACVLHHVEYEQQFVSIQSSCGLPPELKGVSGFPLHSSLASDQSILKQQPVWIEDFNTLPKGREPAGEPLDENVLLWREITGKIYRSWLAVPLVIDDQVYGSLAFYFDRPRSFDPETIELATNFANQTSLALENAQLHAQAEETAIMAERNRLARELHDAVTQTLFSTSLIADILPRLWERNPVEGLKRLQELRTLTRGALAEMRMLLLELRPSALMDTELNELLRHLTDASTSRSRLPIHLNSLGVPFTLPSDVKLAIYRISQEALHNIIKHAEASQVEINLQWLADRVYLTIRDDGCGFDTQTIQAGHLGIGIIRERAAGIDAELVIQSAPGGGTFISVSWQSAEAPAD